MKRKEAVIYEEFVDRTDDIVNGIIERKDARNIYINLGKVEAALPLNEQIPGEEYKPQQRIRVYITKVEKTTRGPQIIVPVHIQVYYADYLKWKFRKFMMEL